MQLNFSFAKAPYYLKIFIIVLLVVVVGGVVSFFKGGSKSPLEEAITSQLNIIQTNQQLGFNKLVNKLILQAPFDLSKLTPAEQNLAFLHQFMDYYPVLKPLLAQYQQLNAPLQASVFMFGVEYRGIGEFVKTNFPHLTRLTYRKLDDLVDNKSYKNEQAYTDAQTILAACHKFQNFNFTLPQLANSNTDATTQASTHVVDVQHPFTLSQLTIPNTQANKNYLQSVQNLKSTLSHLCLDLEKFNAELQ